MASVKSKLQDQAPKSQNISNRKTDLANLAHIILIIIMMMMMKPGFTYAFIQIMQGIHILVLEKLAFQDLSILTVSL